MNLKNKRVLIIGCGSGIGRAIAEGVLREGATVVVASSNAEKVARVAEQLGASASSAMLDVTDETEVSQFFVDAGGPACRPRSYSSTAGAQCLVPGRDFGAKHGWPVSRQAARLYRRAA